MRTIRYKVKPRPKRAAPYDQEIFCRACLDCLQRPTNMPRGVAFEDAQMDFICSMLRTGRWRDYDPKRGPVEAFVTRWFRQWVGFGGGYNVTGKTRGRTERRLRRAMPTGGEDARAPFPCDPFARAELAARAIRVASGSVHPEHEEIFRVALHAAAMGHSRPALAAAAALDIPVQTARRVLAAARRRAAPYITV